MATRRPYVRSMDGWWMRNPYFRKYMAREVTALFVAAYALLLLAGLVKLAQGPAEFGAWMALMRSGPGIALHVVLLLVFAYHTFSWFGIMPKTMPPVVVGGRQLAPREVTGIGIAVAAIASLLVVGIAWSLAR